MTDESADAGARFTVVAFCAQWCGTCRTFEPDLRRLLETQADTRLIWLDIEDDAELAGDIDIEDFPAVAIYRDGAPLYFGTILPHAQVVSQLLRAAAGADRPLADIPEEIIRLYARLA